MTIVEFVEAEVVVVKVEGNINGGGERRWW